MHRRSSAVATISMLTALLGWSGAPPADAKGYVVDRLTSLSHVALAGDPQAEGGESVALLRAAGPAGMAAILDLAGRCPDGICEAPGAAAAIDRVCGVRDCPELRLFWYTELEAAKAAARAADKPILSLRLMGRLDEELSCANSRFFRTVYYRNAAIAALLRDGYVLHWQSVRPVPKVTIDFGDGRSLERTLTGNSIHYVLDSSGRLLDALPGLSGPEAFRRALEDAAQAAREAAPLGDEDFTGWTTARRQRQLRALGTALRDERDALAGEAGAAAREGRVTVTAGATASKRAGESVLVAALDLAVPDDELQQLARLRRPRVQLDAASRAFLLRKHGAADRPEAERVVDAFESTVALDEVINEYRTGVAILRRLADPALARSLELDRDLERLNLWVYEEVFRTPLSDPWLGLAPDDVYVALSPPERVAAPLHD